MTGRSRIGVPMRIVLLGPLGVQEHEKTGTVSAPKHRSLLAALALRAGEAVPVAELAEAVWDGARPAGWEVTLRSYVKRLRQVGPGLRERVRTQAPGYLLAVGRDDVDVLRFERLAADGQQAYWAGDWRRASHVLGVALALWRGEPFADIPSAGIRARRRFLDEIRLNAVTTRIDADLSRDPSRAGNLVPDLRALAAEHPEREHFTAQLMLALRHAGRRDAALAAYALASRRLARLGLHPGPELREIRQRCLPQHGTAAEARDRNGGSAGAG
jgi:DNA-binding SARP family transcriptional activator